MLIPCYRQTGTKNTGVGQPWLSNSDVNTLLQTDRNKKHWSWTAMVYLIVMLIPCYTDRPEQKTLELDNHGYLIVMLIPCYRQTGTKNTGVGQPWLSNSDVNTLLQTDRNKKHWSWTAMVYLIVMLIPCYRQTRAEKHWSWTAMVI